MQSKVFRGIAPGRLDVMGGIADYSGSLVLQKCIGEKSEVSLSVRSDYQCNFTSQTSSGDVLKASLDYASLLKDGKVDYEYARIKLNASAADSWIAYIIGCALILQKEKNIIFKGGDFFIHSSVPLGKGVSSSASLEVATMKALAEAFSVSFHGTELPVLAQKVENLIVGAPCGLMDQLASYFGSADKLLPILCQPDKTEAPISIPEGINFFGIDSGVRHAVGGSSYTDVRCAAFMGYSIIAHQLGTKPEALINARESGERHGLPFHGYLCNIKQSDFQQQFESLLPKELNGGDFLQKYKSTIDHVTQVDPDKTYHVLNCTRHPVYENERVNHFHDLLLTIRTDDNVTEDILRKLGTLMYQAHHSYSQCGLGSEKTDEIVELARTKFSQGIYGAKITGGGSGGTVCILAFGSEGSKSVKDLHQFLKQKYNKSLVLFE
ncbi:galactokinase [Chryseosolibacter indicus]|uniref:GHMP kinase n=1 Tax=Chryseosolibacter indicus TaxID=2782351 RepID=A0ABS5VPH0_9BACT|nr:hypothetical protein [Chryseosolibacter indicus]MBT1703329.1 hypothetical protein [Chryseosolibacter indicus]